MKYNCILREEEDCRDAGILRGFVQARIRVDIEINSSNARQVCSRFVSDWDGNRLVHIEFVLQVLVLSYKSVLISSQHGNVL